MPPDTACSRVEGTGCGSAGEGGLCDTAEQPGDSGETGAGVVTGRPCAFDGCDGGCATAAGSPGMLLLVLGFALLRRALPALLLACLLPRVALAAGIDAQHLQPLDGGEFPALREADAGGAWEAAGAVSYSYASGLVNLTDATGRHGLLEQVATLEAGASIRLAELVRVGVAMPIHPHVRYDGDVVSPSLFDADKPPPIFGDLSFWAEVPILDARKRGFGLAWYLQIDAATGTPELYLGDPQGGVHAVFAGSRRFGEWELLANVGARFATPTPIPGIAWGTRGEFGLGLHGRVIARLVANVELFGSFSLAPTASPGNAPVELLGTVGWDFGRGLVVHAGGGSGLTTGVGSPATRVLVMADVRRREYPDRDDDGLIDMRDRCVDDPEDHDDLGDTDGCPEDDFDGDGIPDLADGCPRLPETVNGHEDRDGCPDLIAEVVLTVTGDQPMEQATVAFGEVEPFITLSDEPVSVVVTPGRHEVKAEAEGFHPYAAWVTVPPGEPFAYTIPLQAVRFGDVTLRVTDPADAPLAGYLRRDGPLELLPPEGRVLHVPAGAATFAVQAPGYLPRVVSVDVPAARSVEVVVALQPSDLRVVGSRIETTQQVRFPLDAAEIPADGIGPLDDLAALLLGDRRIELLRIEGHADERGTSRHNLDLSRRRAEAIRDWLVAAGVAADRLEAIGTGEARPAVDGAAASRRVEFTVLVWADEGGAAAPTVPSP